MNVFDEINLPVASKYIISLMLKKGGALDVLPGTNVYICRLKGKEYVFLGEFTPLTPYMYGVVFSNQKYWFEILKELKMKYAWEAKKTQKRILFLMTNNGFYNAVLEKNVVIFGDGRTSLKNLIKNENMRRVNEKEKYVFPINIEKEKLKLREVVNMGEKVTLSNNYDFEDISFDIDKKLIGSMKKILKFLPGLPFIRLEMFVKDPKNAEKFTLGRVLVSPGVNVFFRLTDRTKTKDAGSFLLSLIRT